MDTNTIEPAQAQTTLFHPLSGWEAATRWNAATFDMMARAWQQWIALLTVLPPHVAAAARRDPQRTSARKPKPVRARG